jgi:hypothetical protein
MSRAIALAMPELCPVWKSSFQPNEQVVQHIGIRVLVNRNTRRRMRTKHHHKPITYTTFRNSLTHLPSNIKEPLPLRRQFIFKQHIRS